MASKWSPVADMEQRALFTSPTDEEAERDFRDNILPKLNLLQRQIIKNWLLINQLDGQFMPLYDLVRRCGGPVIGTKGFYKKWEWHWLRPNLPILEYEQKKQLMLSWFN